MVDATLRVEAEDCRLTRVFSRAQLLWTSLCTDIVAMLGAYLVADAVRAVGLSALGLSSARFSPGWSVGVFVAIAVSAFYVFGLYESEAYVSRPLHLWTIIKASLAALALSALSVYVIRYDAFDESRIVLLMSFVLFILFASVLRLGILDGLCGAWIRPCKLISVLVGEPDEMQALAKRLGELRGFGRIEFIAPAELGPDAEETMRSVADGHSASDLGAVAVFVDAAGMKPRVAYRVAAAAQALGADVYLSSGILEPLQGSRLLSKLFELPIVRLRTSIDGARPYPLKRVLDIIGSGLLLLVCAPLIVVLGIVIRLTSPGPVFHRQTRVGRFGEPFEFLKLRSMVLNGDECIHSEYVRAFMNGTAEAVVNGNGGEAIFKKVDDPRITPVGRFVRKYSLDELPQFWNVFRGDMSLVGPRPPLPYEVNEYDDWDSLRLTVPAGITGLWQVEGRSRVSFDEMILQDLMYAQNMRLVVDVELCLRTIPATLLGGGGG